MAILEEEVWVGFDPKTINHYINKGYNIPKVKNKWGKTGIPKGTKFLVKIYDLTESSSVKLTKICDECDTEISPKQPYHAILRTRKLNNGIDRCVKCGNKQREITKKSKINYENSLEYFALENDLGNLLDEFSDKNNITPNSVSYGSNEKYIWDCKVCSSEYKKEVSRRTTAGENCPFCAGRRVNHTNSIFSRCPSVAKILTNAEDAHRYTCFSKKKAKFTCQICNNVEEKSIGSVSTHGFACSKCGDGLSYPEKYMINLLSQLNVVFETQKKFKWSMNKKYDFYLPMLNCIVETHGKQHYEESFGHLNGARNLIEEQENDKFKEEIAKSNGISNYIIINCSESKSEFLKNQIQNCSKLNNLLDLKQINFEECHIFACNTLVKTACELWDMGIESTLTIGEKLKLNRNTVTRYLKQGKEIGWCNYDPKKVLKNKDHIKRKVIQLSVKNEYITTWDSIREASVTLKISNAGISSVCSKKPKYYTAGGYKWMYKEDYDKLLQLV